MVDSPYYAFPCDGNNAFAKAGARLHGMDTENPFAAVLRVPAIVKGEGADQALAFTLGALTHIIADAVFHPMVYYLTGDYDDPDEARRKKAVTLHRSLETWMDVWFGKSGRLENGGSVLRSTFGAWRRSAAFMRLAPALFFGNDGGAAPAAKAVVSHALVQASFKRRWLAELVRFYGRMTRRDMGELTALFYPPAAAELPSFISGPIRYKNPFTGETSEESLEEMGARADQSCAVWFEAIAANPDPERLAEACHGLIAETPLLSGRPVWFAPEAQMDEMFRAMSAYKTYV